MFAFAFSIGGIGTSAHKKKSRMNLKSLIAPYGQL
jgi:hypothetical protein